MKNSDINLFDENEQLLKYRDTPEWFKQCLLKACTRDYNGILRHIEFQEFHQDLEIGGNLPIVTTLRYIRSIVPDALSPVDDILEPNLSNINLDTCIILIRDNDDEFIEPISNLKVSSGDLKNYDANEIYNYTMAREKFLVLGNDGDISPFGFITEDILKLWKEKTIPYSEELIAHLNKLKKVTENNFGISFIGQEEIISSFHSQR